MPQGQDTGSKTTTALPAFLERNRLLNVEQMADLTGLSVAHIRRLYRTKKFPEPVRINGRKCGWPTHVAMKLVGAPMQDVA